MLPENLDHLIERTADHSLRRSIAAGVLLAFILAGSLLRFASWATAARVEGGVGVHDPDALRQRIEWLQWSSWLAFAIGVIAASLVKWT